MTDKASRTKGLVWLVITCAMGALFAFGLPSLVRAIPWSWETSLSQLFMPSPLKPACTGTVQQQALLRQLVSRIYPVAPDDGLFSIEVQVINDPAVNAYAALGGHIFVNAGLLKQAESPEELAGVLAHEMGHVHHRHILEGFLVNLMTAQGLSLLFSGDYTANADWAHYFLTMGFTRTQETQADEDGLKRLQLAHVDNRGFQHFFARMEKSESPAQFLSDHPSNQARLAMAESFANQDVKPVMTPEEWKVLKGYCSEK